jgi:hypothetical protein
MLNPLTVDEASAAAAAAAQGGAGSRQQQQPRVPAPGANPSVSGWELRLVMEYCDQVSSMAGGRVLFAALTCVRTCVHAACRTLAAACYMHRCEAWRAVEPPC